MLDQFYTFYAKDEYYVPHLEQRAFCQ